MMKKFWKCPLTFAAVLFLIPTNSSATTYYVRADGSDLNAGTGPEAANAWATISKSALEMNPGDIVYVAPGTYTNEGTEIEITQSGSSGNKIQYIADIDGSEFPDIDADSVIVDCQGINDGFILTAASYIVIDGFTINNSNHDGIYIKPTSAGNCEYNEIKNCTINTPDDIGINLDGGAPTNRYLCNYNELHHNTINAACDEGIVIRGGYDGNVTPGYENAYNKIYNNTIDCNYYGIYALYGIDHTEIYKNQISTNGNKGIYLTGAHRKMYTIIHNNMIYNSEDGIYSDGGTYSNYSRVLYNSIYTSRTCLRWEFGEVGDGADLVEIKNNILYTTGSSSYYALFVWDDADYETPPIDYNHNYAPNGAYYAAYTAFVDKKYELGEFNYWQAGQTTGGVPFFEPGFDHNSTWGTDPQYASTTNLHLQAGSPCIGQAVPIAGYTTDIDGDVRDGATPDIGADEWDAAAVEGASNYQLSISNYQLSIYPNPSTAGVRVQWSGISENSRLTPYALRIYDLSGRLVKSFPLIPNPLSLITAVEWDGKDNAGKILPAGAYFCTLIVGKSRLTKKLIIL